MAGNKEDFMEESSQTDRRNNPRKLFRFDPTVSSGTLIQLATVLVSFGLAYGTYRADQTQTKADIDAVRAATANDRAQVQGTLTEIKVELREMRDKVDRTAIGVEVLKAQGDQTTRRTPP